MSETTVDSTGWDATDASNPQPQVWPVCSTCGTPWVYRKFLSMSRGVVWLWGKDCKHNTDPVLHTKDGPYHAGTDAA